MRRFHRCQRTRAGRRRGFQPPHEANKIGVGFSPGLIHPSSSGIDDQYPQLPTPSHSRLIDFIEGHLPPLFPNEPQSARKEPCFEQLKIFIFNGPRWFSRLYSSRKSSPSPRPPRKPYSLPATRSTKSWAGAIPGCSFSLGLAPSTTPPPRASTAGS